MSVLEMRRAVAAGSAPEEVFLLEAPPFATTEELAEGARGLRQSLEGIDESLGSLLALPGVTDVLVNGPDEAWIDAGQGLERVADFHLGTPAEVRQVAVRMAASARQRLDDATPIVDATIPSGVRLHAVLPPLSGSCTVISLRVPAPLAMTLGQLVASGMLTETMAGVLQRLVEKKASGLITGATGTGKTTLLACLLGLVNPHERLICIEEVSELRPDHPHVVHLQARRDNVQGAGGVSLSDLVKAAMRMRPDRLILGEARGAEVREMLSALNTGHRGGWATIHANSAVEVPARLEALGALAGMSRDAVCAQSLPAFEVVVHLQRFKDPASGRMRRQVVQLARLVRSSSGELAAEAVLEISPAGKLRTLPGWAEFSSRFGLGDFVESSGQSRRRH
ncbi:TadA family conjugal transfer-associated ATPase [Mobiluncus porci]|uniref:TadA family conjugal transfer-associated ATPase n=1 Tax=Mobiluncus porci TaxID=2652278 RepID=A0A7K0K0Y3_9ACTO|nr:TadA family conjugal transfer-associated ATPase [Mobiluncus porci]MST49157.1 TadA family conjugal transfer-associated ATPase [Mobiluncus porci]